MCSRRVKCDEVSTYTVGLQREAGFRRGTSFLRSMRWSRSTEAHDPDDLAEGRREEGARQHTPHSASERERRRLPLPRIPADRCDQSHPCEAGAHGAAAAVAASPGTRGGRSRADNACCWRSEHISRSPGRPQHQLTSSAAIGLLPPPASHDNIGQIATSNGAEGIAFATTKSCESPLSISNGISTLVVITALPVATPIEAIVVPLPSTVV